LVGYTAIASGMTDVDGDKLAIGEELADAFRLH
jgi:hypothetical protein